VCIPDEQTCLNPSGICVVGGLENLNSHNTDYHKKMKRGETATNAGKPKTRTLLQKQIAANPTLFDKE
jgi:hypothetical protein